MNKREREVLDCLRRYPRDWVSLGMADSLYPHCSYTFRNGVSDLRKRGFEIEYSVKFRGYKLISEAGERGAVEYTYDQSGQGAFA